MLALCGSFHHTSMIALPWLATFFVLRDCEFAYFTDIPAVQKRKGKREFIMSFIKLCYRIPQKTEISLFSFLNYFMLFWHQHHQHVLSWHVSVIGDRNCHFRSKSNFLVSGILWQKKYKWRWIGLQRMCCFGIFFLPKREQGDFSGLGNISCFSKSRPSMELLASDHLFLGLHISLFRLWQIKMSCPGIVRKFFCVTDHELIIFN